MGGWIVFLLVCFDVDFPFLIVCLFFLNTFLSLLCGSSVVIVDGLLERTCSAAFVCICLCVRFFVCLLCIRERWSNISLPHLCGVCGCVCRGRLVGADATPRIAEADEYPICIPVTVALAYPVPVDAFLGPGPVDALLGPVPVPG